MALNNEAMKLLLEYILVLNTALLLKENSPKIKATKMDSSIHETEELRLKEDSS